VFTLLKVAETIETADCRAAYDYDYRSKSVNAGLDCGLGCTPALSVTRASLKRRLRQLWRYTNEPYLYCLLLDSEGLLSGVFMCGGDYVRSTHGVPNCWWSSVVMSEPHICIDWPSERRS